VFVVLFGASVFSLAHPPIITKDTNNNAIKIKLLFFIFAIT
jgi:hypothetical protein